MYIYLSIFIKVTADTHIHNHHSTSPFSFSPLTENVQTSPPASQLNHPRTCTHLNPNPNPYQPNSLYLSPFAFCLLDLNASYMSNEIDSFVGNLICVTTAYFIIPYLSYRTVFSPHSPNRLIHPCAVFHVHVLYRIILRHLPTYLPIYHNDHVPSRQVESVSWMKMSKDEDRRGRIDSFMKFFSFLSRFSVPPSPIRYRHRSIHTLLSKPSYLTPTPLSYLLVFPSHSSPPTTTITTTVRTTITPTPTTTNKQTTTIHFNSIQPHSALLSITPNIPFHSHPAQLSPAS